MNLIEKLSKVDFYFASKTSSDLPLICELYCSVQDRDGNTWPCSTIKLFDSMPTLSDLGQPFSYFDDIVDVTKSQYFVPDEIRSQGIQTYKGDLLPIVVEARSTNQKFLIHTDKKFFKHQNIKGSDLIFYSQYSEQPPDTIDCTEANVGPQGKLVRLFVGEWSESYKQFLIG